jgi:hypothetical protein
MDVIVTIKTSADDGVAPGARGHTPWYSGTVGMPLVRIGAHPRSVWPDRTNHGQPHSVDGCTPPRRALEHVLPRSARRAAPCTARARQTEGPVVGGVANVARAINIDSQ